VSVVIDGVTWYQHGYQGQSSALVRGPDGEPLVGRPATVRPDGTSTTSLPVRDLNGAPMSLVTDDKYGSLPAFLAPDIQIVVDCGLDVTNIVMKSIELGDLVEDAIAARVAAEEAQAAAEAVVASGATVPGLDEVPDTYAMLALTGIQRGHQAVVGDPSASDRQVFTFLGGDPADPLRWNAAGMDLESLDGRFGPQRRWEGDAWSDAPASGVPTLATSLQDPNAPAPPPAGAGSVWLRVVDAADGYPQVDDAPRAAPTIPASIAVTAGNASATVNWTAPASAGTSPITGYRARLLRDGQVVASKSLGPAVLTWDVSGLPNGAAHTADVQAVNAVGMSPRRTSDPFTPAGDTVVSGTKWGASAPSIAKLLELRDNLKANVPTSDNPLQARHSFNQEALFPATYAALGSASDPSNGFTRSLNNIRLTEWDVWADEYDTWQAAGFASASLPAGGKLARAKGLVQSIAANLPAGYDVFELACGHEPENDTAGNTGTGQAGCKEVSRVAWGKAQRAWAKIVARWGAGRVVYVPILMGATHRGWTYPDGTKRSPEHWDFWTDLTAAEKAVVCPGVDVYNWGSGGPAAIIASVQAFYVGKGFGARSLIIAECSTDAGAPDATRARLIGDPAFTGSLRYAAEKYVRSLYYFHSDVNYTPPATGELVGALSFRAFGRAALGLPY